MAPQIVLFDVIGTTVREKDPNLINNCFLQAFGEHGVAVDNGVLKNNRGKDKKVMIRQVLEAAHAPVAYTDLIHASFEKQVENNLHNFYENHGATEIFAWLRSKGIDIGLGSGLPRHLFRLIFEHLAWNDNWFSYTGISDEIGKSRPDPAMIFDMMRKLNIRDPSAILKVGDTVADIQEGKNAGVKTVAILSGTQSESLLMAEKPDFVIRHLVELQSLFPGDN